MKYYLLTKQQAKDLSILKWQYFYDHPECWIIWNMPEKIYSKLENYKHNCPLCQLYQTSRYCKKECPLVIASHQCVSGGSISNTPEVKKNSYFKKWQNAESDKTRKKYAGLILQIIKEWKI